MADWFVTRKSVTAEEVSPKNWFSIQLENSMTEVIWLCTCNRLWELDMGVGGGYIWEIHKSSNPILSCYCIVSPFFLAFLTIFLAFLREALERLKQTNKQ